MRNSIWDKLNIMFLILSIILLLPFATFFVFIFVKGFSEQFRNLSLGLCGVFASLWSAVFISFIVRLIEMNKNNLEERKSLSCIKSDIFSIQVALNILIPLLDCFAQINEDDTISYPHERIYYTDTSIENKNYKYVDFDVEFFSAVNYLNIQLNKCLANPLFQKCNINIIKLITRIKMNDLFDILSQVPQDNNSKIKIGYCELNKKFIEMKELLNELTLITGKAVSYQLRKLTESEQKEYNEIINDYQETLKAQGLNNPTNRVYHGYHRVN